MGGGGFFVDGKFCGVRFVCFFFSRLLMGLEGRVDVEVCCGWITWKLELRTLVR